MKTGFVFGVAGFLLFPNQSSPTTFVVTNTADHGLGTLAGVVDVANANPGPDLIQFDLQPPGPATIASGGDLTSATSPAGPLAVTEPPELLCNYEDLRLAVATGGSYRFGCDATIAVLDSLVVHADTTLDAAGHTVTLAGANGPRLFDIQPGAALALDGLILSSGVARGVNGDLPFPGGPRPDGKPGEGGAVHSREGVLRATACQFVQNTAVGGDGQSSPSISGWPLPGWGGPGRGAAIYSTNGQVFLTNCVFASNTVRGGAGGEGGGGGPAEGGAIFLHGGVLFAVGCMLEGNGAYGGLGGKAPASGVAPTGPGPGGAAGGGALANFGGVWFMTNCALSSNATLGGTSGSGSSLVPIGGGGEATSGAILNSGGAGRLADCLLSNNRATGGYGRRYTVLSVSANAWGGAVSHLGGTLSVDGGFLLGNIALSGTVGSAGGGGIYQGGGDLDVINCLLGTNRAQGGATYPSGIPGTAIGGGSGSGGALLVAAGRAGVTNSTFVDNRAEGGSVGAGIGGPVGPGRGGAVHSAGDLSLVNSTLAENATQAGVGPTGLFGNNWARGGALCNDGGTARVIHVTIAANAAVGVTNGYGFQDTFQGGGLFTGTDSVTLLQGTILALNQPGSNCYGSVLVDQGGNLSSDGSCAFSGPGSLNDTDPKLGPLDDWGGLTPTLPLLAGSPALDAAGAGGCPATDQRGRPRPFGVGCDIGAFESSEPFMIRGQIAGYRPPAGELLLTAGQSSALADSSGVARIGGLTAGEYVVAPQAPDAVFVQHSQAVVLGPDAVVRFRSYASNALTLEREGPPLRQVLAGAAGETWTILRSEDLLEWQPWMTNATDANGVLNVLLPPYRPREFFRAFRP